jgi:hypothetical protein
VIVLIGIEIIIGLQAIRAGDVESEKQVGILNTLKGSVDTLNTSTNTTAQNISALSKAQADTLETEKHSLTAMQNQLGVLREDQTRMQEQRTLLAAQLDNMKSQTAVLQKQWERQNQAPSLLVIVGTYVLQPDGILGLQIAKPKKSRVVLSFSIRNVGTAPVRRPQLRPDVELPAKLECVVYVGSMLDIENPCTVPTPQLPDILPDMDQNTNQQHVRKLSDLNLYVSFIVPEDTNGFKVHYSISADNLSAAVYSLDVSFR